MKYQEANVEVVDFKDNQLFMTMSINAAKAFITSQCKSVDISTLDHNGHFTCSPFDYTGHSDTFKSTGNGYLCYHYN